MQYMIMNYVKPTDFAESGRPEADPDGPAWGAYTKALIEAGAMRGGEALHPSYSATTIRLRNGKREVQDGPYADTKEQLGGFYLIEAADLDAAIAWAERNPAAASGAVEVRPVMTMAAA